MRFHVPYSVLALALGASAAHAQTVITGPVVGQPAVVAPAPFVAERTVVHPAETIQTIRTVRTVRTVRAPPPPPVRHQVVTTRTITRRVIPAEPAVVAGAVAAPPAPVYDTAVPVATPAPLSGAPAAVAAPAPLYGAPAPVPAPAYDYADYDAPLYDVAPAAPVAPAPVVAAPVVAAPVAAPVATAPVIYRYVYEPDRILVIDPVTNIAVQAIPR